MVEYFQDQAVIIVFNLQRCFKQEIITNLIQFIVKYQILTYKEPKPPSTISIVPSMVISQK